MRSAPATTSACSHRAGPSVPAILPGERFTEALVEYLRSGKEAGITLPDAADPELETFRVVSEQP